MLERVGVILEGKESEHGSPISIHNISAVPQIYACMEQTQCSSAKDKKSRVRLNCPGNNLHFKTSQENYLLKQRKQHY